MHEALTPDVWRAPKMSGHRNAADVGSLEDRCLKEIVKSPQQTLTAIKVCFLLQTEGYRCAVCSLYFSLKRMPRGLDADCTGCLSGKQLGIIDGLLE